MIKLRLVAAAAVAAAASMLSTGAAQAYPDIPNVTLTIPSETIVGGEIVTFKATADVDCDWTISYPEAVNGSPTQTGSGSSITGQYDTKVVTSTFKSPITATCLYDDGTPTTSAVGAAALQTARASATVTLLPKGGNGDNQDDSALPDTGGSNLWILALGGALVVAGGGVTIAARRRHTAR